MDPQTNYCCKKERKTKCCIDLIIFIISILITFVAGLLVGALTELVATLGNGAIIVFLSTLVLLLIIRVITILCSKKNNC